MGPRILEAIRKILTLEALRNFFGNMFRTGSGTSSKRFVFVGGFFVISFCLIKLTNAIATSIKAGVSSDVVTVYGILSGMYTTLVLVGYRKPDSKIDTSRDKESLAVPHATESSNNVAMVKKPEAELAKTATGPVRVDD
jgi:hypothetical protein